jgi:two-component sensor histidine kinase
MFRELIAHPRMRIKGDPLLIDNAESLSLPARMKPMFGLSQTRDAISESDAHALLLAGFSHATPASLHHVAEIIRRLFKADAAGIHVCALEAAESFYPADIIVGALASHESAHPSLGLGLCKMCRNAGAPTVLSEQEIELTYLRHIRPRIVHVLMAPIYDGVGKSVGAAWFAQVTSPLTYSRQDVLVLDRLTRVLAAGLAVSDQSRELQSLRTILEMERAHHSLALSELSVRLSDAAAESELAVREAHHRVKNTLQVASSLLSLQARTTHEGDAGNALREASRRLRVLMHGHEHLSAIALGSQNISLASLIHFVSKMVPPSVAESFSSNVRLEVIATEVLMVPADASAVALIANEVLTNVYKHAFPNNATGSVTVQLTREPDGVVMLRIADTGRGCIAQQDSSTFGLFLVGKLAEQLNATVEFTHGEHVESGTVFTLRVPAALAHLSQVEEHEVSHEVSMPAVRHAAEEQIKS